MGEIKSTLDLVMERTRDLTMTQAEKDELRKKEITGKIKGLVQRYVDGQLNLDRLAPEIERERTEEGQSADGILRKELIERLEPDGDNAKIFELLQRFSDLETEPLQRVIDEFQAALTQERAKRRRDGAEQLKDKGVSGSAVVPNLALDEGWELFYRERLSEARERLSRFCEGR